MPIDVSHLQLLWPARLFAAEARALLDEKLLGLQHAGWLLAEAFAQDAGYELLQRIEQEQPWDLGTAPWPGPPTDTARSLLQQLLINPQALPVYQPPRYYSQRRQPTTPPPPLELQQLQIHWADMVGKLDRTGYFERAFGSRCLDSDDDPDTRGQAELRAAVGDYSLGWPLGRESADPWDKPGSWSEDLFLDLVEALHDYVARPRQRSWHSFHREWDYGLYVRGPGQDLYRWKVNELLDRSTLRLRLADKGINRGRLVDAPGDAREELLALVQGRGEPREVSRIEHAIAQFQRRDATREAKREATCALADVLEQRKTLVKTELLSKDSNALFQIANEFDIRHMNERQKAEYDPLFLDWVFWWYLATIDLTNRLLERQGIS